MEAMSETLLWLVFTKPVEGHEEEFNRWHDEVHLPELRAVPGIRSARQYVLGAEQRLSSVEPVHRYLTVYEIDGNPEHVLADIARRIKSGSLTVSESLDSSATVQTVWHPRGPDPD